MVDPNTYNLLITSFLGSLNCAPTKRENQRRGLDFIINNNELTIQSYGTYIMIAVFTGYFEADNKPNPFYRPELVEAKRFIFENDIWIAVDDAFKKIKPSEAYTIEHLNEYYTNLLLQLPAKNH